MEFKRLAFGTTILMTEQYLRKLIVIGLTVNKLKWRSLDG